MSRDCGKRKEVKEHQKAAVRRFAHQQKAKLQQIGVWFCLQIPSKSQQVINQEDVFSKSSYIVLYLLVARRYC